MEDVASLLFMAGGALSYPLFLHLSLKRSLSIVSREKVANGKVLLSLITLYLETVVLVCLSTFSANFALPSYFTSLTALSAIVILAGYTLKALFGLSLRRGILAFALWQVLCLALGASFLATVLAVMFQTILTIIPIVALMLLVWWMWRGKLRIGVGGNKNHDSTAVEPEKVIAALVIVALLCSSLLVPSAIIVVRCEPQTNSTEQDVDIDFNWNNKTVSGNIAWNTTQMDSNGQGTTGTSGQSGTGSTGQSNPWIEGILGAGEAGVDFIRGFWIPGVLQNLHDSWRDREYLYIITDITRLQSLGQELPPIMPASGGTPNGDWKDHPRDYVKDGALADALANMTKKEFKVKVAENPDVITKTYDVDKYVEATAWASAAADLVTLNSLTASETFRRVETQTHDWLTALYKAGRTFGLSAPALESIEAIKSGDPPENREGPYQCRAVLRHARPGPEIRS